MKIGSRQLLVAITSLTLFVSGSSYAAPAATPLIAEEGFRLVSTLSAPGAISAKVVNEQGKARWLYVSTAASLIIFDVQQPAQPREVGRLPLPTYQNEDLDGNADLALLSNDLPVSLAASGPAGGQLVVASVQDKSQPKPLAVASLPNGAGHTATCLDGCRWALASGGASMAAVDLAVPERPVVAAVPAPAESGIVHDAGQDDDGVVWLSGNKGLAAVAMRPITTLGARVAELSAPATPINPVLLTSTGAPGTTAAVSAGTLHGALRPGDIPYDESTGLQPGDVVLAGEEGTRTDCRDGGRFHTFDARGVRTGEPLRLLDSVAPAEMKSTTAPALAVGAGCSAHWFTTQGPLAAVAWFGAGLRLLDVSDPTRVRQVGRYVPAEPRTWSAYWIPGSDYVYALDLHRGIDVLQVTAEPGGPEVGQLDHGQGSSNVAESAQANLCAPGIPEAEGNADASNEHGAGLTPQGQDPGWPAVAAPQKTGPRHRHAASTANGASRGSATA